MMRIELINGAYRISPAAAPARPAPTSSVSPTPDINTDTARAATPTDRADVDSISIKHIRPSMSSRLASLVAGTVNLPISFAPPPPATRLDRAYFRMHTDHASINAAAVERRLNELA